MTGILEARIARVARVRGCDFAEAARMVAVSAARRREARKRAARRESERMTRARSAWWWGRDFE